ncbi:MAG: T9SS type A sorting domain-containing protein [Bacteroidota bacterium]
MKKFLAFTILSTCLFPFTWSQTVTLVNTSTTPGGVCYEMSQTLSHSAVWVDDGLTLADFQNGTISIDMEVFFGDEQSDKQGLAFLFQQEGPFAEGPSGHPMGYGGNNAIVPSVSIEMDTKYQPWHDPVASNVDHMAMYFNGLHTGPPINGATVLPDVEDGAYHQFLATWTYDPVTPSNSTLSGVLDGTYVISANFDPAALFNATDPIFYGFTSSTQPSDPTNFRVSFSSAGSAGTCSEILGPAFNPFPVEYSSFTGEANGDVIDVKWVTSQESNSHYFELFRSNDGENWNKLIRQEAAGFSESPVAYSYEDHLGIAGANYYRLRQVDLDGAVHVSDMIQVNLSNVADQDLLMLYPNPAQDVVTLRLRDVSDDRPVSIQLFDTYGRLIHLVPSVQLKAAQPEIELPLSRFNDGVYLLKVQTASGTLQQKLMIAH